MSNYKICRLCFQSVSQDNVQIISEIQTEILEVLIIKLDLSVTETSLICYTCWEQLQKNLNFKSKCTETEEFLTPLVIKRTITELNEVLKPDKILEFDLKQPFCRLCMNTTTEKYELKDNEENLFRKFLPEINLDTGLAKLFCPVCYDSLQNYLSFATKCLEWEDKLKQYLKLVGLRKKRKFCLEAFQRNIDKLVTLKNNNNIANKEIFHVASNEDETNIKHELFEVDQNCESEVNEENSVEDDVNLNHEDRNSINKILWKCTQCSFESTSKYYLKKHELMHKGIRTEYKKNKVKFKCSTCSFVTTSKHYLRKHELLHVGGRKKFQCPDCPLKTLYKDTLLKHIRTVHNEHPNFFMCNDCDFKTKHKISIIRHVETHRPKDVLTCKVCEFQTTYPKILALHNCEKKKVPQKFECDICDIILTKQRSLKDHKKIVHNVREPEIFKCEICGFFTKRKSALKKHLRAHERKSKPVLFKCPHCDFKTFYSPCLKKHVAIHQGNVKIDIKKCIFEKIELEKKFKCTECDAAFVRQSALVNHQIVHSEERPFTCKICPFKTASKKSLSSHKNVHNECNIKCDMCNFKTKTNSQLKLHMIKHENMPIMYKCKFCPFESKWKTGFNNHMSALHLGKLFCCEKCDFKTPHRRTIISHRLVHDKDNLPLLKCNDCHFTTRRKDSMRFHTLVHKAPSEVKMFKCTECPFETKYRRSLRNHIRDIHEEGKLVKSEHNEKKKSKCLKWSFTSSLKHNVKGHLDRTHSNKIFNCEECSYTTHAMNNLKCHQSRMHTEFELLKCNLCEFETKYKKSLKNHISNIHEQWQVLEKNDHKQIKRKEFV